MKRLQATPPDTRGFLEVVLDNNNSPRYNPLQAGSIDGTDRVPHDRAIATALNANCACLAPYYETQSVQQMFLNWIAKLHTTLSRLFLWHVCIRRLWKVPFMPCSLSGENWHSFAWCEMLLRVVLRDTRSSRLPMSQTFVVLGALPTEQRSTDASSW